MIFFCFALSFLSLAFANDPQTATIASSSLSGVSSSIISGQEQWWTFGLNAGDRFSASISSVHANGDLDLGLYRGCTGTSATTCLTVQTSTGVTGSEFVTTVSAPATGTYWVRVWGVGGAANTFLISFGREVCSFPPFVQYTIPSGASKCFTTSIAVAGSQFNQGRTGFVLSASNILDSYTVSTGTVDVAQTSADCTGYSVSINGPNFLGTATNPFNVGYYGISSTGKQAALRIVCNNNFLTGNCDITLSSPSYVCSIFQSLDAPSTLTTTATSASTTTPATTSTTSTSLPSSSWAGTYTVDAQCSRSSCCCLTGTLTVTQSGTLIGVTGPISGQCGSTASPVGFSFVLSSQSANSATFTALGNSYTATRNGNVIQVTNNDFPQCSGSATLTTSSSTVCFHKDTRIRGSAGKELTLNDFLHSREPLCIIPHQVVSSDGVKIVTASRRELTVTSDHLIYTDKGLISAGQIRVGDSVIVHSSSSTEYEKVAQVIRITSPEEYFGLNCLHSEVFANGIKASTFGKYHTIPSLWMKVVGYLFGIHRASSIGDAIATALAKIKLI